MRLKMKRIIYLAAVLLPVMVFGPKPALAQTGNAPWCAVISLGTGDVYWDCQYATIEQCVPNVLAGNRGFCNHNPRFSGWYAPESQVPRKHYRYRHPT
jgi:hypothetical protein